MSYNGSGTFTINSTGQPVVAGTVITASAFNALTADLATGLTTAITKDGQTTTTARIPFAQGITSSLVTDSSSTSTGSIITAGGVGIAKALYVGTTANVAGAVTLGGIATFSAQPIFSSLTASSAVATDASKGLVSVTNTGTGNNVLATSPTITTPTISSLSSASATALTLQSAGTTAITVDTSQNVGIGTTSPNNLVQIQGSSGTVPSQLRLGITASSQFYDIGRDYTDGYCWFYGAQTGIYSGFKWATGGTERMRIDSSGNVGIGTTSVPADAKVAISGTGLVLNDASGAIQRFNKTLGTDTGWISNRSYGWHDGNGIGISTQTADALKFGTNSAERMRIDSSGNLLVGTTNSNPIGAGTTGTAILAGGGIRLETSGGASSMGLTTTTGTQVSFYTSGSSAVLAGNINCPSSTTTLYTSVSDYRLKENIVPMTNALATVSQLKPCTYDWISDKSAGQGFIAHELQSVIAEAVVGEKDAVDFEGNPLHQSIDTSVLVATLTAAIQELNAKLEAQALEIATLKAK